MNPIIAALVVLGPGSVDVTLERSSGWTSIKYAGSAPFHRTKSAVSGLEALDLPGGTYRASTWREGTRTVSAVTRLDNGQTRVSTQSGLLRLRFGDFDPTRTKLVTPVALPVASDNDMFVVQFDTQALPDYRTAIEGLGGTIEQYLPDDAYVVRIAPAQVAALRGMDFVRWVGAFETSWRVEPEVQQGLAAGTLGTRDYYVQVGGDSPARKEVAMTQARLIGAGMQETPSEGSVFRVRLTPGQVGKVAAINGVLWLERWTEPSNDMSQVRVVSGANHVETLGGYTGTGVRAHVIDSGVRRTHVAYGSRLTVRGNPVVDSHGTSTTGIVAGDGTGSAGGVHRGMMPTCSLIFSQYQTNWSGANRLSWTQDTVNVHNCVLESNSWGDALTGSYTSISSYMDEIVYKTGLLILNSMSNWGNNTQVRPQAWAKNVMSIGAVNHFNNTNIADDRWQNGASIGPAADGRIKPELAYYYDAIDCPTSSSDTAYTTGFGGTSAATPMTAGAFGLLFQMWSSGEFGNVANGGSVFANRANSTTIKALMIASASRYENQGDITRNVQGWGRANLQNVYDRRNDTFWVDETDVLLPLQTKTYTVFVAPGAPSFLATMTYNDYWAAAGANPTRVNVLSLKVVGPGGTTYWGNNGMTGFQNWTVAGGSADTRNNTQNVFIQNPPTGLYTVSVTADSLPQDGRPETAGTIDADYGLAVVGGSTWIVPTSMAAYKPGALVSGGVAELQRSDNGRVVLQTPLMPGGAGLAESGVVIEGTASSASLPALRLKVEGSSTINNTPFKVYFRDFSSGALELVGSGTRGVSESETTFGAAGDVSRFVETGTNKVQAVIVFERNTATPASALWGNTIDLARWIVVN